MGSDRDNSNKETGDTDGMTTITDIKPIDFNDKAAIKKEIDDFTKKYAYADVEHALVISPNGNMYSLIGDERDVNSLIVGKDALKGSIVIHNHPIQNGGNKGDSFSLKDLKFANENEVGAQYIVSGIRRDAFELTEYHSNEIETIWDKARIKSWEKHWDNRTTVLFEQQDTSRELEKYLKGFKYYENV